MAEKYDHKAIEKKWQERWEESGAFRAAEDTTKQKTYVLDMFPYPSGFGIHMGHVEAYTANDIYSRYKRMRGYEVLHPMGWDAFGLPAENYAIKTGIPPQQTTDAAIGNFRRQIKSLGLSYDWSREIGTHNPDYYTWTQWFFLFLYKNGLAEKKMAKVNWCPKDQTVLANEQTISESGEKGVCVRCGTKVIQKDLEQWFFKITDFADALVDDIEGVDWPESTKINQRNWIGRSEGAEIEFAISGGESSGKIKVFTTRADTLFGATYIVLAPEHPEISNLKSHITNWDEVLRYIVASQNKTEAERAESKEKTGVELKGVKAINPANKEEIPIFVADYVLWGYGTGAIMAVPAHDERDFEFAKKFNVPTVTVITPPAGENIPYVGKGHLENSGSFDGVDSEEAKKKIIEFVGGKMVKVYRLRDWLISRQRYWGTPIPVVYDPEGAAHAVPEEHLPWLLPTDVEFKPTGTSPLGQSKELLERTEKIFGMGWRPEIDTMDTFVCSSWYFFRFADPHNEREFASKKAMQKWLPVDVYMGGAEHTVLHLLYARFFTKALQKHGYVSFGEPFLKLRHQGTILAEDGSKMSKSKGNVTNPDGPIQMHGADAVRLYIMFMGPLEASKPWITKGMSGVVRFVERVWKVGTSDVLGTSDVQALDQVLEQTVKKVGEDIEAFKFNTAVSQMMILLNAVEKEKKIGKEQWKKFLGVLSPFAPHIAHELAERAGFDWSGSPPAGGWPQADQSKLVSKTATVAVQVNGKIRATIELAADAAEADALVAARANPAIAKWLAVGREGRVVYVPGRIISFHIDPV